MTRTLWPQVNEAKRRIADALGPPPQHPRAMAVDSIPHYLRDEAADLSEARDPIKLCHPDRHLIAADFRNQRSGSWMHEPRLPGRRTQSRLRFHAPDHAFEIAGRHFEVEIELAHVLEVVEVDGRQALIEGLDHASADFSRSAIRSPDQADVWIAGRIGFNDRGGLVLRSVIHDDPLGGRHCLLDDAVERPPRVASLVAAGRNQAIPVCETGHASTEW